MNAVLCAYVLLAVASFSIVYYTFSTMKLSFESCVRGDRGPGLLIALAIVLALAATLGCFMLYLAYRATYYLVVLS